MYLQNPISAEFPQTCLGKQHNKGNNGKDNNGIKNEKRELCKPQASLSVSMLQASLSVSQLSCDSSCS